MVKGWHIDGHATIDSENLDKKCSKKMLTLYRCYACCCDLNGTSHIIADEIAPYQPSVSN